MTEWDQIFRAFWDGRPHGWEAHNWKFNHYTWKSSQKKWKFYKNNSTPEKWPLCLTICIKKFTTKVLYTIKIYNRGYLQHQNLQQRFFTPLNLQQILNQFNQEYYYQEEKQQIWGHWGRKTADVYHCPSNGCY